MSIRNHQRKEDEEHVNSIEARLDEMGHRLPNVPTPVASYIPATMIGDQVQTSGQLPFVEGHLVATGHVGAEVSTDTAAHCARVCVLNALAAVKSIAGDLARIERIVKVVVYVASAPGFAAHPEVANGASNFLGELFGPAGAHIRSAVGVAALPLGAPVELELTVQISTD